jgi:Zn-dependent alcohol dehydrogenase
VAKASDGPLDEALLAATGGRGVNYILDTTAVPGVLTAAARALSIRDTLALVGAAAPGTVAPFEIGLSLVKGWTFKTIIQGSSIPQQFIPRLVTLWKQGRFPHRQDDPQLQARRHQPRLQRRGLRPDGQAGRRLLTRHRWQRAPKASR